MRHLKEVLTLILVTNLILVQPTLIDVNITRSFSIALEDATYISQAIYLEKYLSLYDVFWVYAATTINISGIVIPSGTTAIVITLINNGSVPVENIEIFLDLSYIGEVNETTKRYNDKVDPNHSVSFAFKIEPFDNISLSEYDAIMQVFYYVEDTQIYDEMLVPIAVTGYPELKIHSSALYFSSEGDYNLTIEIENIGTGPARKTIVHTLGYPPYVTVLGDDWSEIGIIPAGTKKKVTFTLHIIESGVSAIPIFVNTTFMDQRTTDFYSVAETIPVIYNETPRLSMISSVYVPTKLFPGDKNVQINVVISNPTMKIIRNIIAELILPNDIKPSYAGSSRVSLGSLPPGYTVTLTYYLDIEENAKPRSTNLELLVIFDGGKNRFNIPIIIERKGSFSIESISPSILELGKRGITLQIGIINNGSVNVDNVYLELMASGILKGELVSYVGKLESGESKTVSFSVDVSSDAPIGNITLDLKISWIQEGRFLTSTYGIKIAIRKTEYTTNIIDITIITAIIGLTVILVWPLVKNFREIFAKRGGA